MSDESRAQATDAAADGLIDTVLKELAEAEGPPDLRARVLARLAARESGPRWGLAIAAALTLLLGGVLLARLNRWPANRPVVVRTLPRPTPVTTLAAPASTTLPAPLTAFSAPPPRQPAGNGSGPVDAFGSVPGPGQALVEALADPVPLEAPPLKVARMQVDRLSVAALEVDALHIKPLSGDAFPEEGDRR